MDYGTFTDTILQKVLRAMRLINNPEIDPETRQLNQEILFRTVGRSVYAKIFDMNAFDFDIPFAAGPGIEDRYFGLAKVASYSVSTGDQGLDGYVKSYIDNTIAMAQRDAMTNAIQNNQHPTVVRSIVKETCAWCVARAGTYTNADPEVFIRHTDCDCRIETFGYKSRNGLLNNYVKPKDR